MSRSVKLAIPAIMGCLCLVVCSSAHAQGFRGDRGESGRDESWYYQQTSGYDFNPQAIVQQKAMERAQQRSLRLTSLSWYGMSNARPTAAATPFTSRYSPVWEMPGGRPFAWNPGSPQLWQGYIR
jgi:hypothetical protein